MQFDLRYDTTVAEAVGAVKATLAEIRPTINYVIIDSPPLGT
jgi:hypothetical protein